MESKDPAFLGLTGDDSSVYFDRYSVVMICKIVNRDILLLFEMCEPMCVFFSSFPNVQLDIMEPKVPEDIYKSHLESTSKSSLSNFYKTFFLHFNISGQSVN